MQRIRTIYCFKDLIIFWMTRTQKIWICCLKQLGSILLNKKNKYELLMHPYFLTVKLARKKAKQWNKTFFYQNTYGRRMWFKYTISMYYFKRIGILSKNSLFTAHFLHYLNCYKNPLKSLLSSTVSCQSTSTIQEKSRKQNRKDISAWKTCNIFLNDKSTETKNSFVSESSQYFPEW